MSNGYNLYVVKALAEDYEVGVSIKKGSARTLGYTESI
jgi:hypothetical protein